MKNALPAIMLLIIISLSGCINQNEATFTGKDCGTNATCFNAALANCEPAKIVSNQTWEGSSISVYSEIRNGTADNCTVYGKIKGLSLSENASSEMKMAASLLVGMDMTCRGNINETMNGISVNDVTKCTGMLADIMKSMMNISQ